jgi:PAS domain S-box-containing protein
LETFGRKGGVSLGAGGASAALVGSALAFVGLVLTALFIWQGPALFGELSAESQILPAMPLAAFLLGASGLLAALGVRSKAAGIAALVGLVIVVLASALAWVPSITPELDAFAGALNLWTPQSDPLAAAMASSSIWLVAASAPLALSTFSTRWTTALAQWTSILVTLSATVLALMFVLSSSGPTVTLTFGLMHALVAHAGATCALRLASDRSGFAPERSLERARAFLLGAAAWTPLVAVALAALMVAVPVTAGLVAPAVITAAIVVPLAVATIAALLTIGKSERAAQRAARDLLQAREEERALQIAGSYGTWSYDPAAGLVVLSECAAAVLASDQTRVRLDDLTDDAVALGQWLERAEEGAVTLSLRGRALEFSAVREGSVVKGTVRDVTARAREEAELRSELEVLRCVAQKVPDVDFIYSLVEQRYVYMNRPIGELLGDPALTSGSFMRDHVVPEHKERLLDHIAIVNSASDATVYEVEFKLRSPDGREVWVRNRASVFERDGEGRPILVFGTSQDVTHLHEVLQRLQESEGRYQRLAARMPGVIYQFRVAPTGRVSIPFISEASGQLFGMSSEDVMARPEESLGRAHPDDRPALFEAIERSRKELSDFSWVGRFVAGDGSTRWVKAHSRPTLLEDGTVHWDGIAIDVTESVESERALRQTKERLDFLLAESPTVVYDCEPSDPYEVRSVAPNIRTLLGFVPEQLVGKPAFGVDFVHPDDKDLFVLHKKRFVDHGRSSVECRLRTISGDYVWVRDDVRLVSGPGEEADVVGAWTDISVQRRSMERTLASEARLQRLASRVPGMVFEVVMRTEGGPEFTYVSTGSYELIEVPPGDVRSRPESFLRLIEPSDKARLYRDLVRTQRDLTDLEWEGRVTLHSGREKWVRLTARPNTGETGETLWSGVATDVTESRAVQESLSEHDLRFAALANSLSEAVVTIDHNGTVVLMNPVAERLTGYLSHEVVGLPLDLLNGGLNLSAADAGRPVAGTLRRRDGTLVQVEGTVVTFDWKGLRQVSFVFENRPVLPTVAVVDLAGPLPERDEAPDRASVVFIAPESETGTLPVTDSYETRVATTVGLGLEMAKRRTPNAIVLFHGLPDSDTESTLRAVRSDDDLKDVEVLLVGAPADVQRRLLRQPKTHLADTEGLPETLARVLQSRPLSSLI